ncbi:YhgE/Pip family protein [Mediterraneibacter gnavus]|uniref:YhgE/Pip family protein n=1 Tax=Mediterraneibacter gnavus TaxID=33038 RepID=UPI00366F0A39
MKKIGQVFLYDISHIKKNVIAMIVVLGLCVVPSLYAWFNIAASWDPYSNTNGLKVAVANKDEGYEGEILPLQINIGDTVISSLRENDQLDWTFTGKKDAVEGVKSGKYYAAIVIPKSFSQDMMSLFSEEMTHSDIIYYINEKENAIAPKVTDKGASAVQQQIDEIFVKTAAQVGLDLLDTISEVTSSDGAQAAAQNLTENIRKIGSDLDSTAGTVKAFSNMTVSMQQMLDATADILNKAGQNTETNLSLLNETGNSVDSLRSAVSGTTESVNQVLAQGSQCYDAISGQINNAFSSISTDAGATAGALNSVASEVQVMIDRYTGFRDSVQQLADSFPLASDLLQPIIGNLNESIAHQEAVRDKLNEAAEKITETASDAGNYQAQLDQLVQQSSQQISGIRSDYENNVKTQINTMFGTLGDTSSAVQSLFTSMDNGVEDMEKLAKDAGSGLEKMKTTLDTSASLLTATAEKVNQAAEKLDTAAQDGNVEILKNVLGSSPEVISSFVSAPVRMQTKALYPVENYGSAMAPFYSTLSIWVGGIILVAMMKVTASENLKRALTPLKPHQIYLGRYLLFLVLGLIQSGLICLGDLYFLGIQCEHPFLFLLAGWVSSVVYVNIIYTFTVSFGDVGKAICVVLLVMQVAGSGGTFPIEVAPEIFQKIYPFLPFTHSMTAMRECVAGFYQYTYWAELGIMCLFLLASLFLGLVLRKPVIRLNELFIEKLEDTKLM